MQKSFTAPGAALASAVHYTSRWLAAKPTIPAHGGLLFDVADGALSVSGFNESATARASLPVDGDAAGQFVVAGRLIDQLVATFPDKPVTFEQDGTTITVTAGKFRATLPAMSENDYPTLPGEATFAGTVDASDLAAAAHRVGIAASRDLTTRIALAGIHVSFDEGIEISDTAPVVSTITLTATDSYRAARQSITFESYGIDAPMGEHALVMAATLMDAAEAFGAGVDRVRIGYDKGVFSLTTPARSLVTRTLGEEFPAAGLKPVFDQATTAAATVSAKDLALPLKRADLLNANVADTVRMDFRTGAIIVNAQGELNGGDEEISVEYDGPNCSVMVRSSLLQAALASAPNGTVVFAFVPDSFKPVVLTSPADPAWRHILVPMRGTGHAQQPKGKK